MPESPENPSLRFGELYQKRLRHEALAGFILNGLSLLTPRLRRQRIEQPTRIGILCQWGIGDAVLLLPLLHGLRQTFPNASLELIGKAWLSELFEGEDCCDQTHFLVPPWTAYINKYKQPLAALQAYRSQIQKLRSQKFDWLISARFDPREILQLRLLRAKRTIGFGAAGGRFWITHPVRISRAEHDAIHRGELARIFARALEARPADDGNASFLKTPQGQAAARGWLVDQGYRSGPILAVHTGAGHPNRRWREKHFDTVLNGLTTKPAMVVFVEDPGSEPAPWNGPIPHAHWMGSVSALKALLSLCDVFLGTDSGVMHMASAAGCKVIAIFGSAEPLWFSPALVNRSTVIKAPMPCRPCYDKCIYSSPVCIEKISDSTIVSAVDQELARLQPAPALNPAVVG